jgi:hypothetical protein
MDAAAAEPELGSDFKGIERFYPALIIREAVGAGELSVAISNTQPYSVSKAQLEKGKEPLSQRVVATNDTVTLASLIAVVKTIGEAVQLVVSRSGGI